MKAVLVLAVLCCAAVAVNASGFLEKRRVKAQSHVVGGERVECDRITGSCEECAKKQYVNGRMVQPCHWDHITKSCNFQMREPHYCEGNQGYPTMECARCQKRADAAKEAKAKQAATAAAAAGAATAAAGKAGKAGKYCTIGGLKGICLATTDRCTGGRPFARTGCMDPAQICCGLSIKTTNSKQSKADPKCAQYNGAGKCWSCLRAGCEMHIATATCTHSRHVMARSGDKNVVGSEAMCYLVAQKQKEARDKVRAKAKARREAKQGKKF